MSVKGKSEATAEPEKVVAAIKKCFVIMPIADMDGYEPNHFLRVYEHLIKPAIQSAGYEAHRADFVNASNYIIIDILRKIVESDIVVCDLSGRNPNVLYELGVRQAFNLPAVLIKDRKTPKIFDIQGLRYTEYSESLRIDEVQSDRHQVQKSIMETASNSQDINSMIQLLGVKPASLPKQVELSNDTSIILESIKDIAVRISKIESSRTVSTPQQLSTTDASRMLTKNGKIIRGYMRVKPDGGFIMNSEEVKFGDTIYANGEIIGTLLTASLDGLVIKEPLGRIIKVSITDEVFPLLSLGPF